MTHKVNIGWNVWDKDVVYIITTWPKNCAEPEIILTNAPHLAVWNGMEGNKVQVIDSIQLNDLDRRFATSARDLTPAEWMELGRRDQRHECEYMNTWDIRREREKEADDEARED